MESVVESSLAALLPAISRLRQPIVATRSKPNHHRMRSLGRTSGYCPQKKKKKPEPLAPVSHARLNHQQPQIGTPLQINQLYATRGINAAALQLGLPFVPSFLGQTGSVDDMIRGVNYASAGAGIIFSSCSELGQHISLSQQIQQVMDTFQQFIITMGEVAASNLISKSIFYISIGNNDYIHYYLLNESKVQSLYLPWSFNQFLARAMKQEIQNLYNASVRNVIVVGLTPLGCAPYYLWLYESKNGECVEMINDMIVEFNFAMRFMAEELNQELVGANIVFCDTFEGSMNIMKNSDRYGFNVTTDTCCGVGQYRGWIMCISSDMACRNASNHVWWDQFHPTDAVNKILADNVWSSSHINMCFPMNLLEMVAQNASH